MPPTATSYDEWMPISKDDIEPLLLEISQHEDTLYTFEPQSDMDLEDLQALQESISSSIESADCVAQQLIFMKGECDEGSLDYENIEIGIITLAKMVSTLNTYARECVKLRQEKGEDVNQEDVVPN